tara:strand:- start:5697 stop:6590 length:894 start_codon:yes stop_codon:yes gene_type:complete
MKTLTLKHIHYLSVLNQTGSFKEASKIIGLSQSAFIHSIRRIEDHLGVQLVISKKKADSVQINPEHQWVLEKLTNIDVCLETFNESVEKGAFSSSANLCLDSGIFLSFLAPYYQNFVKQYPFITLNISEKESSFISDNENISFNTILFTDTFDTKEKNTIYIPFYDFSLTYLTNQNQQSLDDETTLNPKKSLVCYEHFCRFLNKPPKEEEWGQIITVTNLGHMISLIRNFQCVFLFSKELAQMNKINHETYSSNISLSKSKYQLYLKMNKYFAKSDVGIAVTNWILECRDIISKRLN